MPRYLGLEKRLLLHCIMKRSKSETVSNKKQKGINKPASDIDSLYLLSQLLARPLPTSEQPIPTTPIFSEWFREISQHLCHEVTLQVGDNSEFRIVEVEMYLLYPGHQDTFSHGDDTQLNSCGQWYFHRQNGKSFKGGTYKGLDISFGTPGLAHGGILIRSLETIDGREVIEGPCRCVDAILEASNRASIINLVESSTFSLNINEGCLRLVPKASTSITQNKSLVACPRVGLTLKRCDEFKPHFLMSPYRFHCRPDKMSKYKSTAILYHVVNGFKGNIHIEQVASMFNASQNQIQKLIDAFEAEKKKSGKVSDFIDQALKADDLIKLCAIALK